MGEEIAVENGRISDFNGLVTLTLNRVILHTVMHHSSTSTYIPNFIEIEETFCGRTDGRTHFMSDPLLLGRLGGVDLKMLRGLHRSKYIILYSALQYFYDSVQLATRSEITIIIFSAFKRFRAILLKN